jgi:hypothetical protein
MVAGAATGVARNPCTAPAGSRKSPTMRPRSSMPTALVDTAPGTFERREAPACQEEALVGHRGIGGIRAEGAGDLGEGPDDLAGIVDAESLGVHRAGRVDRREGAARVPEPPVHAAHGIEETTREPA